MAGRNLVHLDPLLVADLQSAGG
jgi:hypothetical protein